MCTSSNVCDAHGQNRKLLYQKLPLYIRPYFFVPVPVGKIDYLVDLKIKVNKNQIWLFSLILNNCKMVNIQSQMWSITNQSNTQCMLHTSHDGRNFTFQHSCCLISRNAKKACGESLYNMGFWPWSQLSAFSRGSRPERVPSCSWLPFLRSWLGLHVSIWTSLSELHASLSFL